MVTSRHIVFITVLLLAGGGCNVARVTSLTDPAVDTVMLQTAELVAGSDAGITSLDIVGHWESSKCGRQVLAACPDGTATLTMSLSPMAAAIYGRNVTLNLQWTLDGEYLTQHIVGGYPAKSVEKLVRKFGDTATYRVLEHDAQHLLVADIATEVAPVNWTRVADRRGN